MGHEISVIAGMPDQRIDTTVDGKPITLRLKWNERFGYWFMSIYTRSLEPILGGIKMVPNVGMISFLSLDGINGDFILGRCNTKPEKPTLENIGTDFRLFWLNNADIEEFNAILSARS
ncbi:phage baseplate plug family protein [Enterobacter kobei]|uniref:phage baseplate plug family protein n=1 Tax=Enterobacter kobei TaxID=208224 RepID=UPI0006830CEE|nr:hypothetical protein [Enterobacter kobei]